MVLACVFSTYRCYKTCLALLAQKQKEKKERKKCKKHKSIEDATTINETTSNAKKINKTAKNVIHLNGLWMQSETKQIKKLKIKIQNKKTKSPESKYKWISDDSSEIQIIELIPIAENKQPKTKAHRWKKARKKKFNSFKRAMDSIRVYCATMLFVILCVSFLPLISSHVALTYPPARKYDLDFLDNTRTRGPCGMPKGERQMIHTHSFRLLFVLFIHFFRYSMPISNFIIVRYGESHCREQCSQICLLHINR